MLVHNSTYTTTTTNRKNNIIYFTDGKFPQTEEYEVNLRRARFERCYNKVSKALPQRVVNPVLEGIKITAEENP